MPEGLIWYPGAEAALLADASEKALSIVSERIVDEARPRIGVLKTRPPGRREWKYSLPAGRLRSALAWTLGFLGGEPYAEIGVTRRGLPLAWFRALGGGRAAYGNRGDESGVLPQALAAQVGRPIP